MFPEHAQRRDKGLFLVLSVTLVRGQLTLSLSYLVLSGSFEMVGSVILWWWEGCLHVSPGQQRPPKQAAELVLGKCTGQLLCCVVCPTLKVRRLRDNQQDPPPWGATASVSIRSPIQLAWRAPAHSALPCRASLADAREASSVWRALCNFWKI